MRLTTEIVGKRNLLSCTRKTTPLLVLLLVLLCLCLQVQQVSSDNDLFDEFDENHDGSINRDEYNSGLNKLKQLLHNAKGGSSANNIFTDFFVNMGDTFTLTKGFWNAFTSGVAMILATEIGDKTFFIAAVLSMRSDRIAVFSGAILALIIMTILSSAMGFILPNLIPQKYTHIVGGILFLYFGFKLLMDSRSMEANKVSEELEEVEEELLHPKKDEKTISQNDDEEVGNTSTHSSKSTELSSSSKSSSSKSSNPNKTLSFIQVFIQSLTLTFVAEWGDRSQIATIALSSHKNPYGVTVGGCIGHSLCTGLAVVGGRMLAARISEKSVAFYGGIIFLCFGIHSLFFEE